MFLDSHPQREMWARCMLKGRVINYGLSRIRFHYKTPLPFGLAHLNSVYCKIKKNILNRILMCSVQAREGELRLGMGIQIAHS